MDERDYKAMNKIKPKKIHIVIIRSGEYEDVIEKLIFATFNKNKAYRYIVRFNKIVNNNKDRLFNHNVDINYNLPFMFDWIVYEKPRAIIKTINLL